MHADVEANLYQEVAQVLGDVTVKFEHFVRLTYCTQVMRERPGPGRMFEECGADVCAVQARVLIYHIAWRF